MLADATPGVDTTDEDGILLRVRGSRRPRLNGSVETPALPFFSFARRVDTRRGVNSPPMKG